MFWRQFWQELGPKLWSPEKLARYLTTLALIIVIIAGAYVIFRVSSMILMLFCPRRPKSPAEGRRRTIITVIRSLLLYTIGFGALVLVLRQLGVNYAAILAGAGVVGLAVGFGAQTLVRDIISGFFILFEGLIQVGDYIRVGDNEGTVEQIGLRTTQFRGFNGMLFTIPNGELTRFGNFNRGFSRALVDIEVPYDSQVRELIGLFHRTAQTWAGERSDIVLEPPEVLGVLGFGEAGVRIRLTVKVQPQRHWEAERELRLRLKNALDGVGISIPPVQREVKLRNVPSTTGRA